MIGKWLKEKQGIWGIGGCGGGALSRGFGKSKDLESEVKNYWGSGSGDHWDKLALSGFLSDLRS